MQTSHLECVRFEQLDLCCILLVLKRRPMKRFVALMMCVVILEAAAQVTYPYNPDEDGNGQIALSDLHGFLAAYDNFSRCFGDSNKRSWTVAGHRRLTESIGLQFRRNGCELCAWPTLEALEEEIDQLQAENQDLNDHINNLNTQRCCQAHQDYHFGLLIHCKNDKEYEVILFHFSWLLCGLMFGVYFKTYFSSCIWETNRFGYHKGQFDRVTSFAT